MNMKRSAYINWKCYQVKNARSSLKNIFGGKYASLAGCVLTVMHNVTPRGILILIASTQPGQASCTSRLISIIDCNGRTRTRRNCLRAGSHLPAHSRGMHGYGVPLNVAWVAVFPPARILGACRRARGKDARQGATRLFIEFLRSSFCASRENYTTHVKVSGWESIHIQIRISIRCRRISADYRSATISYSIVEWRLDDFSDVSLRCVALLLSFQRQFLSNRCARNKAEITAIFVLRNIWKDKPFGEITILYRFYIKLRFITELINEFETKELFEDWSFFLKR